MATKDTTPVHQANWQKINLKRRTLTNHQFKVYQKLKHDQMVNLADCRTIFGISDMMLCAIILGMNIPVFHLGTRSKRYYVFSGDIVEAVAAAEQQPTIEFKRSLYNYLKIREEKRRARTRQPHALGPLNPSLGGTPSPNSGEGYQATSIGPSRRRRNHRKPVKVGGEGRRKISGSEQNP